MLYSRSVTSILRLGSSTSALVSFEYCCSVQNDLPQSMSRVALDQTLKINQLLDLDWAFGVCAASDESENLGGTFLKMKFAIDKDGKREDVLVELTLPQFYNLLTEMEKAKALMDSIAGLSA